MRNENESTNPASNRSIVLIECTEHVSFVLTVCWIHHRISRLNPRRQSQKRNGHHQVTVPTEIELEKYFIRLVQASGTPRHEERILRLLLLQQRGVGRAARIGQQGTEEDIDRRLGHSSRPGHSANVLRWSAVSQMALMACGARLSVLLLQSVVFLHPRLSERRLLAAPARIRLP